MCFLSRFYDKSKWYIGEGCKIIPPFYGGGRRGHNITRTSERVITLWRSCELFLHRDISRVRRTSEISLSKTMNMISTDDHHELVHVFMPYYYWLDVDFNGKLLVQQHYALLWLVFKWSPYPWYLVEITPVLTTFCGYYPCVHYFNVPCIIMGHITMGHDIVRDAALRHNNG